MSLQLKWLEINTCSVTSDKEFLCLILDVFNYGVTVSFLTETLSNFYTQQKPDTYFILIFAFLVIAKIAKLDSRKKFL